MTASTMNFLSSFATDIVKCFSTLLSSLWLPASIFRINDIDWETETKKNDLKIFVKLRFSSFQLRFISTLPLFLTSDLFLAKLNILTYIKSHILKILHLFGCRLYPLVCRVCCIGFTMHLANMTLMHYLNERLISIITIYYCYFRC